MGRLRAPTPAPTEARGAGDGTKPSSGWADIQWITVRELLRYLGNPDRTQKQVVCGLAPGSPRRCSA